jgi:pimeloyl-ACP methyl ester carboxylesterase
LRARAAELDDRSRLVAGALPTLVLLPGMDGTGDLFDPFLARLDPAVRVTVVRYPADRVLGLEALQDWARAALPAEGRYVLLGESFSGPIAVALAGADPPRLAGLVLCCTCVRNPWPWLPVALLRPLVGLLPMARTPPALLCRALLGRFETPALRAAVGAALAKVGSAVLQARLRALMSVDVSGALAAVRVPTLYLRARHDRMIPASAADLVLRLRPSTRLDAPHGLLQTASVEAARVVEAFLAEPDGPVR